MESKTWVLLLETTAESNELKMPSKEVARTAFDDIVNALTSNRDFVSFSFGEESRFCIKAQTILSVSIDYLTSDPE